MKTFFPRLFTLVALSLTASAAQAVTLPMFQVSGAPGGPLQQGDSNVVTGNSVIYNDDLRFAGYQARAGHDGIGTRAEVSIGSRAEDEEGVYYPDRAISAGGRALARAFDVIFTPLHHPDSVAPIAVSTNLLIHGTISVGHAVGGNATASGGLTVTYGLGLTGLGNSGMAKDIGRFRRVLSHGIRSGTEWGIFADRGLEAVNSLNGSYESPTFFVPVNTPLRLTLQINASASAASRDGSSATAMANFYNTLTLPTDSPVFNMPEGYAANSIDGRIFNNRLVPAAVPLPAPLMLLLGGVAAMIGLKMRTQKTV